MSLWRTLQLWWKARSIWGSAVAAATEDRMNGKSLLSSKTFWVNLLGGLAGGASWATGVLPPQYLPYVLAAGAVANILLRVISDQPITSVLPPPATP